MSKLICLLTIFLTISLNFINRYYHLEDYIILLAIIGVIVVVACIIHLMRFIQHCDDLKQQITLYKKSEPTAKSTTSIMFEIILEENEMPNALLFILGIVGGIYLLLSLDKMFGPSTLEYEHVNRKLERMIVYNVPRSMDIGKDTMITAAVCKELSDTAIIDELDSITCEWKKVTVSSKVRLRLIETSENKNFTIVPLSTDKQLIDDYTPTKWKWNVSPKRRGYKKLLLIATLYIKDNGVEYEKDIEFIEKTIKINPSFWVTVWQFISIYWQFLATAIVLPLIVWLSQRIRSQKLKKHSHLKYLAGNRS